jgi:multiple sugar transport system ATP-binding protein
MRTELKRLHKDTDSTFVYVTHDQLEAMTLATRICLINQGVLQQFDPPLVVYNNPANLFVADFVGNPTMNFIPGKAKKVGEKEVEISFFDIKARFHAKKTVTLTGEDIVLGIRPEFLPIRKGGKLEGLAYSTLPTGMETTVKIDLDGDILSAVVFGSIDYETDAKINFDIVGEGILLFDATSKKNIGIGSVDSISHVAKVADKKK